MGLENPNLAQLHAQMLRLGALRHQSRPHFCQVAVCASLLAYPRALAFRFLLSLLADEPWALIPRRRRSRLPSAAPGIVAFDKEYFFSNDTIFDIPGRFFASFSPPSVVLLVL